MVQTRGGDGLPQAGSHGCGGKQSGSRCILEVEPVGFVDILMTLGVSACGSIERTVPVNQEVNIRASGTLALRWIRLSRAGSGKPLKLVLLGCVLSTWDILTRLVEKREGKGWKRGGCIHDRAG